MQIKVPICYDVSHYKEILDFNLVEPKPFLFITKATESVGLLDEKFSRFFQGMIEIGCIRGAYHFFRKYFDPIRQAEFFVNTISKFDILPTDLLILDVEEGGEKASQLWAWFEYVKNKFPNNKLVLYSRKNILEKIVLTPAEKEYFKKITVWTAGYPYFPDLFSKVPSAYIPDQTKWGKVGLWQYSEKGVVKGIKGSVDLNLIEPNFYSSLGSNSGEITSMATYTGKTISVAKIFVTVGGQQIDEIPANTSIKADQELVVSGIKYLHLVSPVVGYSKAQWFSYTQDSTTPPPPPPPPTITPSHTIDVYPDGKISIDNGTPF